MTLPGFMPCPDYHLTPAGNRNPSACPGCEGAGQVPDPDTVDSVAEALADLPFDTLELRNWGEESIARVEWVVARTALHAYARYVKENV